MVRKWKIGICGIGSIGSRHLRNLIKVFNELGDELVVDLIRSDKDKAIPKEFKDIIKNTYN